uniref:Uncharacterized protein n=1 Tax=Panagrolaimus davidi TaxID=227884 RepID=A0A914Q7V1_9BILA
MTESDLIYTSEDLDRVGALHWFTALILIFTTSFTIFIVLKYSSKAMGNYKYYILMTVFAPALLDFHVTAIFGVYPILPIAALCGTGLVSRHLDLIWGEAISWVSGAFLI